MKNIKSILTLILGIVGFIISLHLAFIYFDANLATGSTGHFCSINSVVDCNGVAQSSYSAFLGIPLAIWGMLFYSGVIGLSLLDIFKEKLPFFVEFQHPMNYLYLMSIFSLFVAVALAYISTAKLHKICILCYMTYGINAMIFAILAKNSFTQSIKFAYQDTMNFLRKLKNTYILPFLSIFFVFLVMFFNHTQILAPNTQALLDRGNILGDKNSHLRIYVYTDYNCPYCQKTNQNVIKLAQNIDGIRIEKIEYPIDNNCNPNCSKTSNNSCLAAKYALASKKQGKYILMSSLLFENHNNLTEKNILKIAQKHGIDPQKLKKDANSEEIKNELFNQIQKSSDFGINSTPSTKIGVKIYNYYLPYNELYKIVSEYKNVVP